MKAFFRPLCGIYVHWPYCLSKCPYCDFASRVCKNPDYDALLKGYERDILIFKEKMPHPPLITSLYFGGGTPSLMPILFFDSFMTLLQKNFSFAPDIEISLEANPDAVTQEKMRDFKQAGVNRLSIGVQALNESDLRFLGRRHSLARALDCVHEAQNVFDNLNIDLIYARPNQTLSDWEKELKEALSLNLPHYSLYQLTIEENTVFGKKGILSATEETAVALYELTNELMRTHHVPDYEISNYARAGFECRHNLTYWHYADYLGMGPSAQGRIAGFETVNPRTPADWLAKGPSLTKLTPLETAQERVIMGLRLKNSGFPCSQLAQSGIQKACENGWGYVSDNLFYPTKSGFLMLNQLILLVAPDSIPTEQ